MSDNFKKRFDLDPAEQEMESREELSKGSREEEDLNYATSERFEEDKVKVVDFLKFPRTKRKMTEFMEEAYKSFEQESVERTINRVLYEHKSELEGSTEWHKPGHIGPLMYEYLNMIGVESAFVSGLQHTKSSLTKTVQQRVDEINTLLRGVGGFNRQIKASFTRSAAVYLEQEDPRNKHRERVIFSINLGDFELRYPLDESAEQEVVEDGRTLRRMVWDEAVNTLSEIVSNTGMKPKYVKNDKNSCVFTMKQYLLSKNDKTPDEYFSFELRYINQDTKNRMSEHYHSKINEYNEKIEAGKKQKEGFLVGKRRKKAIEEQIEILEKDRDFYIGTHPDPEEIDCGLIFSIYVNTMKDYTITKDKMQVIMTKYILALSEIAVDKSMDQQVNTVYQQGQNRKPNFQDMDAKPNSEGGQRVVVLKNDLLNKKKAG
ncbi:MAG: hypothetical protein JXA66_08340 [Oligoflexia bacterium]|nr:hypothetical protein [Oligoflexia bacterium]